MIKEIKFNGYSATPSDYDCPDGDLAVTMGVVPENGALHYIEGGAPVRRLYNMDAVYVHQTASYKHYITINEARTEIGWIDGEGENTGTLITSATKIADVTDFVEVNSIGNTLIIVTKTSIIYCLWKDGSYALLGNHLPNVNISFGLVGHPRLYSQSDGSKSTFDVVFEVPEINPTSAIPTEDGVKQLTSQVMAKVNKFVREQTIDKGRFCFPFLVRYALRLYDGTSLVCHSAPILMRPTTTAAPIVTWSNVVSQGAQSNGKYHAKTTCDIMLMAADLDYAVIKTTDSEQLGDWKDVVKSIDVFISKPIYTYDQNGEIDSLYDSDNFSAKFVGRLFVQDQIIGTEAPREDWIRSEVSVSGATSAKEGLKSLYSDWKYSDIYPLYFGTLSNPSKTMHLPEFEAKDINDSIANTSSFYKLFSIPIEDIELETRKTIEIDNTYLNSLVAREAMTDDYLTHDRLMAKNTQVYNNRLHLSGVKRELFKGFPMMAMCAYRNDSVYVAGNTITPGQDSAPAYTIRTFIKEDGNIYCVTSTDITTSDFRVVDPFGTMWDLGGYIFYPNMNAYKMEIWRSGDTAMTTYELQPHPHLNGACIFIGYGSTIQSSNPNKIPETEFGIGNIVPQLNKLYVSEFNNPFYFPVLGIYSIGVGDIYNISPATKALSEGQFGQFPLYAFTSDGVWALSVSATGSYSAVQPFTRDVCTNPSGITQIDGAVLFATDRGIMLLSGSETICISEILDSDTPFKLATLPRGEELLSKFGYNAEQFDIIPFKQFLTGCDFVYDYVHQKIYVFNPACAYCYVYSLESKAWGMNGSTFKSKVNSYPEALYMATDGILRDLSLEGDTVPPTGVLTTRPLKLDAPDVLKTISSIIVRGNFRKGDIGGIVLYGSRDLKNWFMVASSKDHFLRGFSGTAYKYFRIAIRLSAQNSGVETCITGCTIQYSPKQNNQLR